MFLSWFSSKYSQGMCWLEFFASLRGVLNRHIVQTEGILRHIVKMYFYFMLSRVILRSSLRLQLSFVCWILSHSFSSLCSPKSNQMILCQCPSNFPHFNHKYQFLLIWIQWGNQMECKKNKYCVLFWLHSFFFRLIRLCPQQKLETWLSLCIHGQECLSGLCMLEKAMSSILEWEVRNWNVFGLNA